MRTLTSPAVALAVLVAVAGCTVEPETSSPPLGRDSLEVGTLQEVTSFGSNPAQLRMFLYVPDGMPSAPRPLVVAMHGCQQNASQYTIAGWHDMADLWKFYIVYPEQNSAVNNSLGCFNWGGSWDGAPSTFVFNAPLHLEDIERGHTENQSIIEMVDYVKDNYSVDDGRVYATGLSAGGGFTAVMLATWPDVFAGGAIVAGIPYGCPVVAGATTEDGKACVSSHPEGHELNRTAEQWGALVRNAYPGYEGPYPRVQIWHGSSDFVVAPALMTEHVEQWTNVHAIDMEPDVVEQLGAVEHAVYKDGNGRALVETFLIGGMSHGQPVASDESCGEAGLYFNDVDICAAKVAVGFFGLDGTSQPPPDPSGPDAGSWFPPPPAGADAGPNDEPRGPGGFGGCGCRAGGGGSASLFASLAVALLLFGTRRRRWTR